MRVELKYNIAFSAITNGNTLAPYVLSVKDLTRVTIGVNTTSIAGSPTGITYQVGIFPTVGGAVLPNAAGADTFQSATFTGTGFLLIDRLGAQVVGMPAMLDVFEFINIYAILAGGSSPSVTGTLYVWGAIGES